MVYLLNDKEGNIIIETTICKNDKDTDLLEIKSEVDIYNYGACALTLFEEVDSITGWEFVRDIDDLYTLDSECVYNCDFTKMNKYVENEYKRIADYYNLEYVVIK